MENNGPEMIFFGLKKNEISKNQSSDSVKQDINLVWPNIQIMLKKESFSVVTSTNCITANNFNIRPKKKGVFPTDRP
jgi:hypothetical protein